MPSFDLVVIGGGLVGSAIAWGASRLGATVAILDGGDTAFRASRGNFGLVWIQGKGLGMPEYARWSRRSAALWPDLVGDLRGATDIEVPLRQAGGLYFCLSEEEFAQREIALRRMHNEIGDSETRMLRRRELDGMVPALGEQVVGASYSPLDGQTNPLPLLRALHEGVARHGGAYFPGRHVDRIDPGADFAVHCGAERFTARRLVIAAGLGARALAPLVGLDMPVHPERGQVLVTERLKPFLDYTTHTVRQTPEGSVMLGDSKEEVGFDNATTPAVTRMLAARAITTFPALARAQIVRTWGALRVMTPDGFPVYDQSARFPGAFAATCHSGVTLAGAHALALAPAIMAGALPDDFASFSARRFSDGTDHVSTH